MRKRTAYFAVITLFAATFAAGGPLAAQTDSGPELDRRSTPERPTGSVADAFAPRDLNEEVHVFIQLDEPSVAEAAGNGAGPAAQRAQGQSVLRQQSQIESDLAGLIQGEPLANLVVGANGFRAIARVGDIPAIRAIDGVLSVARVTRYFPTNESSVPWIGGSAAQSSGFTGDGLTIAVIDTGIDYTHAAFGGSGDPNDYDNNDPGVVETGTFPTAKVVNGFDFAGPVYDASEPDLDTPSPDSDPLDVHGHGTHVAATAAGVDVTGDLEEGMAPDAELLALKVFGDVAGSTDVVSDAIEFALDPNNDLSIDDAVDVINMSLGSPFGHPDDPSAIASANAADLGVTVVASAGNEGPVPYITGSPAVADGVISVAASVDGGVEVLGLQVNSPAGIAGTYEAQPGDFGPLSPPTPGDLAIAEPIDACDPITSDVAGDIALIQRGTCDFTVKIREAQDAGAIGALVFNNVEGPPIAMGQNGTPNQPTIPAMMVDLADGQLFLDTAEGPDTVNVTLTDAITIPKPELADTMADFTSQGPGFGNVFKPDLSAPGFNIGSADVGTGTDLTLSSGTSMAAPHVAGAAAQLLEAHPDLTPAEVKALLMNSATPAEPDGSVPISRQGTGVIHIDRAASDLGGYTTPAGLAFHLNPTAPTTESQTVDISRLADDEVTYDVAIVGNQSLPGVTWDVSAATVTTTGGTGSVEVSVSADPTAMDADDGFFSQAESDGWLVLTNDSDPDDSIVVGLVAVADPASDIEVAGGEDVVAVANDGPSSGFADGFTKVSDGDGSLAAVGYRTGFVPADQGGPYATIDLGIAFSTPWSHPSANEIDVFIDTDQDGTDDYAIVAADLGVLSGVSPTGDVVTAIFTLDGSQPPALLYFTFADMNDQVIVLPADLTGDFGFLADDDSTFDITTVVFDQLGVAGASETVTVDLEDEVTAEAGLSLALPPGASGEVATSGEGEMLWLYQNDGVPEQFQTTSVTTAEEEEPPPPPPPPPPGETPSFTDVPGDHLFHTEITWLAEQGITRGCNPPDNDRFCPDDSVTRGQMAAFMNRGLGLPATTVDYFDDDGNSVFEMDINELAESGITRGCNPPVNDEFCPERTITRAEMATFMVRGFDFVDGAGDDLFVDDDDSVHESDIDILGTAGVTKGCNPPVNDEYCPGRDITRGEMAAFIFRAFQAAGLDD